MCLQLIRKFIFSIEKDCLFIHALYPKLTIMSQNKQTNKRKKKPNQPYCINLHLRLEIKILVFLGSTHCVQGSSP